MALVLKSMVSVKWLEDLSNWIDHPVEHHADTADGAHFSLLEAGK